MYDVPKFLKREKESLLFNQDGLFVFYVPEMYFERNFAIIYGDYVNLLGILDYAIFDKTGKHKGLKQFRFPTMFTTRPHEMEKLKGVKLTSTSEPQDYRMLKYKKDDQVVTSVKVPQNVENAEMFYKIFLSGKLPTTVPYDTMHEYFIENISLNKGSYNLNMQLFGIMVSEMCRDRNDINKLFRNSNMKNMTDYTPINIREIPKTVSPFTSMTSENWNEGIINGINNKDASYSPLEKLYTV